MKNFDEIACAVFDEMAFVVSAFSCVPLSTIAVSGGFDPLHVGHVRLFKEAAKFGNLIVIINSDDWLTRKKGYVFMPWEQRAEIISSLGCVHSIASVDDSNGTVCEALDRLMPNFFANGGDRTNQNTPELELCKEMGITPLFGIGGDKIASSSELVNATR